MALEIIYINQKLTQKYCSGKGNIFKLIELKNMAEIELQLETTTTTTTSCLPMTTIVEC